MQGGQFGRTCSTRAYLDANAAALYDAMIFFIEFSENDTTNEFLDSKSAWPFTARTTGALAQTSSMSANNDLSLLTGRAGFTNTTEGNSIYIPTADSFALTNSDWTFGLWCKTLTATGGTTRFLMGNVGSSATDFQSYIAIDTDDQYHFFCTTDGAVSGRTDLDSTHNPHATSWTLLAATLDRSNNQMTFRVRRQGSSLTTVSTAFAGALYTGATTANFCINDGLSGDSTYFAGNRACVTKCDQAFYCARAINDAEFNYLFNSGSGRTWAQLQTDAGY